MWLGEDGRVEAREPVLGGQGRVGAPTEARSSACCDRGSPVPNPSPSFFLFPFPALSTSQNHHLLVFYFFFLDGAQSYT